jgi:hypothetical protein
MRYYFHLQNATGSIPDDIGIDIDSSPNLLLDLFNALCEMHEEQPDLFQGAEGWRVNVADGSGVLLFSLPLDGLGEPLPPL